MLEITIPKIRYRRVETHPFIRKNSTAEEHAGAGGPSPQAGIDVSFLRRRDSLSSSDVRDGHSRVHETDPPGSPPHTAELIDDILASDERAAPILAANHTPPGGIFNVSGTSTISMRAYYENGTIGKYRILIDTPGRTVVPVEPVETFPSRCYPAMVAETRTVP
jgi:hypothetical protein